MDVSYGKKVKDTSSRGKTSKEEWKEREASANQAVPTRVKIFEGGSVERLTVRTHLLLQKTCICAPCLVVYSVYRTLCNAFRYKSNEDYVYVRGRGRGKYICEECGIRCKKPSMLKKHIRTHTDVRPYICRVCNFAFKTKGEVVIRQRKTPNIASPSK